jgi:ribosomal protein S18 acetylase RimI-like enzyme
MQAELVAHRFGVLEDIGAVRVAHHLDQAFAVAQVDEDHAAVVAATVHPAAQADGLAEQCLGSEAAVLGSHGHGCDSVDRFLDS